MKTIADQWTQHANRYLPNDVSAAQVQRARRDFYYAELERLSAIPSRTSEEEALFREALGFGSVIGRAVETA